MTLLLLITHVGFVREVYAPVRQANECALSLPQEIRPIGWPNSLLLLLILSACWEPLVVNAEPSQFSQSNYGPDSQNHVPWPPSVDIVLCVTPVKCAHTMMVYRHSYTKLVIFFFFLYYHIFFFDAGPPLGNIWLSLYMVCRVHPAQARLAPCWLSSKSWSTAGLCTLSHPSSHVLTPTQLWTTLWRAWWQGGSMLCASANQPRYHLVLSASHSMSACTALTAQSSACFSCTYALCCMFRLSPAGESRPAVSVPGGLD